jgi:hypothetical protein
MPHDIHFIDEPDLRYHRPDGSDEDYATTLDATLNWVEGEWRLRHAVEFTVCINGDWLPVPAWARATWFGYLMAGSDRARVLKHMKNAEAA